MTGLDSAHLAKGHSAAGENERVPIHYMIQSFMVEQDRHVSWLQGLILLIWPRDTQQQMRIKRCLDINNWHNLIVHCSQRIRLFAGLVWHAEFIWDLLILLNPSIHCLLHFPLLFTTWSVLSWWNKTGCTFRIQGLIWVNPPWLLHSPSTSLNWKSPP